MAMLLQTTYFIVIFLLTISLSECQITQEVVMTCDFEDAKLCNFTNVEYFAEWKWSGEEEPANGYRFNNSDGNFIFSQLGPSFPGYNTSRIISPTYTADPLNNYGTPQCVEFYYYMDGDDVGQMNVYIAYHQPDTTSLHYLRHWFMQIDAGPGWKRALMSVIHSGGYALVFESVRGHVDSYHAVDDITLYNKECYPSDICDYDTDVCLWSSVGAEEDTGLYWTRYQASNTSIEMAPNVDHTTNSSMGWYMVVESSPQNKGKKAWLYSRSFPITRGDTPRCFRFSYYIFGDNPGQLKVFIRNSISSRSQYSDADLWEINGMVDNKWHDAHVNLSDIYIQEAFMIIVEAAVGDSLAGAFAIDDTFFTIENCSTVPADARVTADALESPDCNFNRNTICSWTDVPFDNYTFSVSSDVGGWQGDHTSTGSFVAADCRKIPQNETVRAVSALLPPTFGLSCFSFWYRLFKDTNSSLAIDMVTVGKNIPLWKALAEDNDMWTSASFNIHSDFDYKLLIRATVGNALVGSVGVDDIKLVHGACPRSEVFDFENGFMGFTQTDNEDDNTPWQIIPGFSSFVKTDHTYESTEGHVLEVYLGQPVVGQFQADIKTPLFLPARGECLEFWYIKKGSDACKLSVLLTTNTLQQTSVEQWITKETTTNWVKANVEISSMYTHWIQFRLVSTDSLVDERVAIDDIRILPTLCPSNFDCDFEYDECGYISDANGLAEWHLVKGMYENSMMPVDHTVKTEQGSYMEVDIPHEKHKSGNLVHFTSSQVGEEYTYNETCISYWFYGFGKGMFQVQMFTNNHTWVSVKIFNITDVYVDRIFRAWNHIQLNVSTPEGIEFIVFLLDSETPNTSAAIDDIAVTKRILYSLDKKTTSQSNGENLPDNSEHESSTGIDYDHTKNNRYGHYIYLDSTGQKANTTAQLVSPSFSSTMFTCLRFYYVMNGKDVSRLNVYLIQDQTRKLYWTTFGDKGKEWHHRYVEIISHSDSAQLMLEAVAEGGDMGDIGLDDVWLYSGSCPGEGECTFEEDSIYLCNMDQDNLDEADWEIWSGVSEKNTDPQVDHTYQTDEGHYIRMHMNTTQSGDRARIFTKVYDDESAKCLEFWYHIKNPVNSTHTLFVIVRDETGIETTIASYEGFFDDVWNPVHLPIALVDLDNFQIGFQGESGGEEGVIAIDDIMVSEDECDEFISCGFDSEDLGLCGWEPVTGHTDPPWIVRPSHHYIEVNFTSASQITEIASETLHMNSISDICLSLSYMMHGDNVGYLNISYEVEYPEPKTITGFSVYGSHHDNTWSSFVLAKPQGIFGNFRYVITATSAKSFDSSDVGIVRVADIFFANKYSTCLRGGAFTCEDHTELSDDKHCNFIKDCPQGEDEKNCGSCDFETQNCGWTNTSSGPLSFVFVTSVPDKMDAGNHAGHRFMGLGIADGEDADYADLALNNELGPSPSGCTMAFSYYLPVIDRSDNGNLYLVMEENLEETELWHSSEPSNVTWHQAYVDIGGIHSRFKLHFRASQLPYEHAMGIDDVAFIGCSFPEPVDGPCQQDQFKCNNKACIDNNKLCDFTDECGDGSDEDPALCAGYVMDNFEDSLGYWSQDVSDNFDWARHAGSWISTTSGPRRDHTLGTHFGHFIVMDPRGKKDGYTAHLVSPEFQPTQDDQCKIRFYYHMYGASDGLLTLFMKSKVTGSTTVINEYRTTLNDSWLLSEQVLSSQVPFQVVLEGKVEGYFSTEIGLDDISFTPSCLLDGSTTVKPTVTPVSTKKTTTKTPVPSTKSSTTATKSPVTTTKSPVTTTKSPVTTTKSPATTTKSPVTTTKSPTTTTKSPVTTTKSPTTTTKSPVTTTKSPTTTTKSPVTTTKSPTTTTKSPVTTTKSPTTTTKSPVTTTKSPTTTTKSPVTTSKNPVTTKTSVITTPKTPGTTPKTPFITSKTPTSKGRTSQTPVSIHSTVPTTQTGVTKKSGGNTGSGSSDSWKIAVGVVLGLVGLIAIIAGTFIYLKRTQRLAEFSFSFLRRNSNSDYSDRRPIFGRHKKRTTMQLDDVTPY